MRTSIWFRLTLLSLFCSALFLSFVASPLKAQACSISICGTPQSTTPNSFNVVPINLTSNESCVDGNDGIDIDGCGNQGSGTTFYIVNCKGHILSGEGTNSGINLLEDNVVIIQNCRITDFQFGVFANEVTRLTIQGGSMFDNSTGGLALCNTSVYQNFFTTFFSGNPGGDILNNTATCGAND